RSATPPRARRAHSTRPARLKNLAISSVGNSARRPAACVPAHFGERKVNNFLRFVDGSVQGHVLQAAYDPTLVVLSYFVAAYAAYTALDFAVRVKQSAASWLGA